MSLWMLCIWMFTVYMYTRKRQRKTIWIKLRKENIVSHCTSLLRLAIVCSEKKLTTVHLRFRWATEWGHLKKLLFSVCREKSPQMPWIAPQNWTASLLGFKIVFFLAEWNIFVMETCGRVSFPSLNIHIRHFAVFQNSVVSVLRWYFVSYDSFERKASKKSALRDFHSWLGKTTDLNCFEVQRCFELIYWRVFWQYAK